MPCPVLPYGVYCYLPTHFLCPARYFPMAYTAICLRTSYALPGTPLWRMLLSAYALPMPCP
eukprot:1139498-Rhodomonas_salina.1